MKKNGCWKNKKGAVEPVLAFGYVLLMVLIVIMFWVTFEAIIKSAVMSEAASQSKELGMLIETAAAAPETMKVNYYSPITDEGYPAVGTLVMNRERNTICVSPYSEGEMWYTISNNAMSAWMLGEAAVGIREYRKWLNKQREKAMINEQNRILESVQHYTSRTEVKQWLAKEGLDDDQVRRFMGVLDNNPDMLEAVLSDDSAEVFNKIYQPAVAGKSFNPGKTISDVYSSAGGYSSRIRIDLITDLSIARSSPEYQKEFQKVFAKYNGVAGREASEGNIKLSQDLLSDIGNYRANTYYTREVLDTFDTPAGTKLADALMDERTGRNFYELMSGEKFAEMISPTKGTSFGKSPLISKLSASLPGMYSRSSAYKFVNLLETSAEARNLVRLASNNRNVRNLILNSGDELTEIAFKAGAGMDTAQSAISKVMNSWGGNKKINKMLLQAQKSKLTTNSMRKILGRRGIKQVENLAGGSGAYADEIVDTMTDLMSTYGANKKISSVLRGFPDSTLGKVGGVFKSPAQTVKAVAGRGGAQIKKTVFSKGGQDTIKIIGESPELAELMVKMNGRGPGAWLARYRFNKLAGKAPSKLRAAGQKFVGLFVKAGNYISRKIVNRWVMKHGGQALQDLTQRVASKTASFWDKLFYRTFYTAIANHVYGEGAVKLDPIVIPVFPGPPGSCPWKLTKPYFCLPIGSFIGAIINGISQVSDYFFTVLPLWNMIEAGHQASQKEIDRMRCYSFSGVGQEMTMYVDPPNCNPTTTFLPLMSAEQVQEEWQKREQEGLDAGDWLAGGLNNLMGVLYVIPNPTCKVGKTEKVGEQTIEHFEPYPGAGGFKSRDSSVCGDCPNSILSTTQDVGSILTAMNIEFSAVVALLGGKAIIKITTNEVKTGDPPLIAGIASGILGGLAAGNVLAAVFSEATSPETHGGVAQVARSQVFLTGSRLVCAVLGIIPLPPFPSMGTACTTAFWTAAITGFYTNPEATINTFLGANILPKDQWYYVEFPYVIEIKKSYDYETGESVIDFRKVE